MSQTPFPKNPTVRELQDYIWQMNIERKFDLKDAREKFVLLMEEMGELARAVRKETGIGFSATTSTSELAEELADVQIVLLGLASLLNVDMIDAVRAKEDKNRHRSWN